eukprot:390304-Prymnesium_polylepis.1
MSRRGRRDRGAGQRVVLRSSWVRAPKPLRGGGCPVHLASANVAGAVQSANLRATQVETKPPRRAQGQTRETGQMAAPPISVERFR